jgi:7-cyano-7-deazaguanine synthase
MKVIVLYSGGLDSTVLLYDLLGTGHEVKALSVHYGQRHARELDAAAGLASDTGVEHRIVHLEALAALFPNRALTSPSAGLPQVDYSPESLEVTTVPNRNMLLLATALSWAAHLGYDAAAYAAHAGATITYPDCRPDFARAMVAAARLCDWRPLEVLAPFVDWTKAEVVRHGATLGVPFARTWSCYGGGSRHCGRCGTCRDRQHAFAEAGVADPTEYA